MMRFKDQIRFILKNTKKNKVRTIMTILASAIGCAFLIVLASVGFGLQKSIVADTLQDQVVTEIQVHSKSNDNGDSQPLTMKNVSEMQSLKGVKTVTRRNNLVQAPIFKVDGHQTETNAIATDFTAEKKSGFKLYKGHMPKKQNEVIVAYDFAKALSASEDGKGKTSAIQTEDLLGKTMEMDITRKNGEKAEHRTFPVKIVGIQAKPAKEWMQGQDVYISYDMMEKVDDYTGTFAGDPEAGEDTAETVHQGFDQVSVYANSLEDVQSVTDQLEQKHYMVYSVIKEMKQINVMFTIIKAGLILVGTIAVIIASIGIYNTMTMAVTERAPDIGIMKAIGANPKTIKRIFLLESSFIGLIGAAVGIVIAYGTSLLVNVGMPLVIEAAFDEKMPENLQFSAIPPMLVLIAVVICIAVTIISGVRPAKHATRIDVLQAMRREI